MLNEIRNETLKEYLERQKKNLQEVLNEYESAKAEFEIARKKLESFGDMSTAVDEIAKIDGYIKDLDAPILEAVEEVSASVNVCNEIAEA